MSWTEITREEYRRDGLRYASDTRDEEWKVLAPLMPKRCRIGRPREVDLRKVLDAILYILATGCKNVEDRVRSEEHTSELQSR